MKWFKDIKSQNSKKIDMIFIILILIISSLNVFLSNQWKEESMEFARITPIVKHMQDPSYLKNDFFVKSTEGFSVRYYYAKFLYGIDTAIGNLNVTYFLFLSSSFFLLSLMIYFLMKKITNDAIFSLGVSLCLQFFIYIHLGGINLFYPGSNIIPFILTMASFILFLKNKTKLAYFVFGFGAMFQPIYSILTYVTFVFCYLWEWTYPQFNIWMMMKKLRDTLPYFISSAIMFVPLFVLNLKTASPGNDLLITQTIAIFHSSYHSVPSTWPIYTYLLFFIFLVASFFSFKSLKITERINKYFLPYLLVTLIILFLGTFFVEVIPIGNVAKAQFFRVLTMTSTFCYIAILWNIYNKFKKSKTKFKKFFYLSIPLLFFYSMSIFLGSLIIIVDYMVDKKRMPEKTPKKNKKTSNMLQIYLLPIYIFIAFIIIKKIYSYIHTRFYEIVIGLKSILIYLSVVAYLIYKNKKSNLNFLFFSILIISGTFIYLNHEYGSNPKEYFTSDYCGDIRFLSKAVQEKTEKDSIFIIPITFIKFSQCAQRAVFVDLQAEFTDKDIIEWNRRIKLVEKMDVIDRPKEEYDLDGMYHNLSFKDILAIKNNNNVDYILFEKNKIKHNYPFEITYVDESYIIYKVK